MATTAATPPMIDNLFTPLMSIFPLDDLDMPDRNGTLRGH
jgi:hypothetical protein